MHMHFVSHFCRFVNTDGNVTKFRELRRVHYDEFRKVKQLRREGSSLEDASSDEEDEKNNGKIDSPLSSTTGVKDVEIEGIGNVSHPQPNGT